MAESSSYGNSINFYERMSHLQGELKNYESQQFQLEEEFQRLWTQGISQTSPSSNIQQKSETTDVTNMYDHFSQVGHLSNQSQLLANQGNLNYYSKNDDVGRRRARNQAILEKLQELETNASIFAARSERLRMMRNEYETLVKKCAWDRQRDDYSNENSIYNKNSGLQDDQAKSEGKFCNTQSRGVNTDITGPIQPFSVSTDSLHPVNASRSEVDHEKTHQEIGFLAHEELRSSIIMSGRDIGPLAVNKSNSILTTNRDHDDYYNEINELDFMTVTKPTFALRRPTFPDISSTSESERTTEFKHQHQKQSYEHDNIDETSADTTSLSVLMPNSRFSNYKLNVNVSTDGSLSQSTSLQLKQAPTVKSNMIHAHATSNSGTFITSTPKSKFDLVGVGERRESLELDASDQKEKRFINFVQAGGKSDHQHHQMTEEDLEEDSRKDSTSRSVGDSMMDSIYNKTPESLPKDDSELVHITEVDEEEYNENRAVMAKDQQNHELQGQRQQNLINEMGSQMKGNWPNLSSSNLVRVAQKEIATISSTNMLVNIIDDENITKSGERLPSSLSEFDSNMDFNPYTKQIAEKDADDDKFNLDTEVKIDELSRQCSTISGNENENVKGELNYASKENFEKAEKGKNANGGLNSLNEEYLQRHVVDLEEDGLGENGKNFSTLPTASSNYDSPKIDEFTRIPVRDEPSTNQDVVKGINNSLNNSTQQRPISKSKTKGDKNATKKIHLKLNYDDSESETSDKVKLTSTNATGINPLEKPSEHKITSAQLQKELDDEFDDFYV